MPSSRQSFSKPSAVKQEPRSVGRCVTRNGKAPIASSRKAFALASVSPSSTARGTRRERRSVATNRTRSRRSPSAVRSSGGRFTSRRTKPSSRSLSFAAAPSGVAGAGRAPPGGGGARAGGLGGAVDVGAAGGRQGAPDHEGEVVEREAGRAPQGAHDGPLLPARLPGRLARTRGTVAAVPAGQSDEGPEAFHEVAGRSPRLSCLDSPEASRVAGRQLSGMAALDPTTKPCGERRRNGRS